MPPYGTCCGASGNGAHYQAADGFSNYRNRRSAMNVIQRKVIQSVATFSLVVLCMASLASTRAFAAEDFYKGKVITIFVSGGGTYEAYARYFARYLPKYLPGEPAIIVKSLSGAAGLKA